MLAEKYSSRNTVRLSTVLVLHTPKSVQNRTAELPLSS